MCASPKGGKWRTSTAPWSQNLSRMPPCTHCRWYVYLNSFVCIKPVHEQKEKSTPWGACLLPVYSECSRQLSQTDHVAQLQSSLCQIFEIFLLLLLLPWQHALPGARSCVPHQNSLWSWGCCLCYNVITNKPFFSYCSAPAAFLCTATGSPHHISHQLREGCLTDWQSPRHDL